MSSGPPQRFAVVPRPPHTFTDDTGREISIEEFDGQLADLVAMYDEFDTSQRAQGLPPLGKEAIREWLDSLTCPGAHNLIARHEGAIVGHTALIPNEDERHELAIFVHQDYQRAGIGEGLLRTMLTDGRNQGVERVWLVVEHRNRPAINLYQKLGFETIAERGCEREMERCLPSGDPSGPLQK
ncbi:MAG: N-acetyltransferase family protein [Halodesulfurarchaeum sp.]